MGEIKTRSKTGRKVATPAKAASTEAAGLNSLLKRTALGGSGGTGTPKFVRSSGTTLEGLRSLPSKLNLVLFTPAVPPAGNYDDTRAEPRIDPFEPLGRALSEHHKRIRHVPYVPNIGITQTHLAFLQCAGAVVVVVCDASSDTAAQQHFCRSLSSVTTLHGSTEEPATNSTIPTLLVVVSEHPERSPEIDPTLNFGYFDTVLQSVSYAAHDLGLVANCIFGS